MLDQARLETRSLVAQIISASRLTSALTFGQHDQRLASDTQEEHTWSSQNLQPDRGAAATGRGQARTLPQPAKIAADQINTTRHLGGSRAHASGTD
jgi:hypothetical protein